MYKNTNIPFIELLKNKLSKPLLGTEAQSLMAPEARHLLPNKLDNPRKSAVLILFYKNTFGEYSFPIIRRPEYDGVHSGQMALPGGKYEEADQTLTQTALRESCEEIGICQSSIEVLGELSDLYIPITNMCVKPIVATTNYEPNFVLEKREVDELFSISLSELLNPQNKKLETWELKGKPNQVPFYHLQNQKVWGATAMMLSELEQIIIN